MLKADLNWLPTSLFKGIKYPIVIYEEDIGQNYSGFFTHKTNRLTVVDNNEGLEGTIVHEFCHYLQDITVGLPDYPYNSGNFKFSEYSYEEGIERYFKSYWWEMQALLFENKIAKDWCNDWWLRKLVRRN